MHSSVKNMLSGRALSVAFQVNRALLERFAALTWDRSSLHTDLAFGRQSLYGQNVAHGMLPLAFLLSLPLGDSPNKCLALKRLSARFARPVLLNHALVLELFPMKTRAPEQSVEFELVVREVEAPTPAITGRSEFVQAEANNTDLSSDCKPTSTTRMPLADLQEQTLELEQIGKGDAAQFSFDITQSHIRSIRQLLAEALGGSTAEVAATGIQCDPANFLATCMLSTFVGMCLPGRQAVLLNFQIAFEQSLQCPALCQFRGEVIFKSPSARTLMEQFAIQDRFGSKVAAGRINCLVGNQASRAQALGLLSRQNAR